MPRKQLILSDCLPYHVTNRANNKDFWVLGPEKLWPVFIKKLAAMCARYNCQVHAFVLMSNHYHLFISTPDANLAEAIGYFQKEVAVEANRMANRQNHFFGGRYKWSLVHNEIKYWNCVKYIFRNPVRAGICDLVESYPYSSLNFKSEVWKMTDLFVDAEQPLLLSLEWLNEPTPKEIEEAIRRGLRRREFTLPKSKDRCVMVLPAISKRSRQIK